jgi:hypothetical protein
MMIEDNGRTLAQDEIDAMLKAAPKRADPPPLAAQAAAPPPLAPEPQVAVAPPPAPAPQAAAPAPPAPVPQAVTPAAPAPGVDPAIVADLTQRLAMAEAAVGRIGQLEATLAAVQAAGGPKAQDFQAVVNQLKKVSGQVDSVMQGLQNTPGYGTRRNFQCGSCGTQGMVVSLYRCSKCGKEKWLGWWPQQ